MEDLTQLNLLIPPQGDPAVAGAPIGAAAFGRSSFEEYLAQAGFETEGKADAAPKGGPTPETGRRVRGDVEGSAAPRDIRVSGPAPREAGVSLGKLDLDPDAAPRSFKPATTSTPEVAELLARLEPPTNEPRLMDTVPRPLAEELLTSHPVWKQVALASRQVSQVQSAVAEPPVGSSETKDAGTIVHMSADVPNQSDRFERQGAPQQVPPPRPAKPVPDTTFSLEPARKVTMVLGDSDAEVRVQIRDQRSEVALRCDAPSIIRSGLEGSVHNLVEALNREQVPVADVFFSGRFGTGTDAQSHDGNPHSSRKQTSMTAEPEDASFTTEFESSAEGSLVNIHA